MTTRSHRIPSARQFAAISSFDQWQILDLHREEIEQEIACIQDGAIYGRGGKHYLLKLARARLKGSRPSPMTSATGPTTKPPDLR